ncbi:unnamed protein product, partial [Ectocarpus sp. 12 AP-2014]
GPSIQKIHRSVLPLSYLARGENHRCGPRRRRGLVFARQTTSAPPAILGIRFSLSGEPWCTQPKIWDPVAQAKARIRKKKESRPVSSSLGRKWTAAAGPTVPSRTAPFIKEQYWGLRVREWTSLLRAGKTRYDQ